MLKMNKKTNIIILVLVSLLFVGCRHIDNTPLVSHSQYTMPYGIRSAMSMSITQDHIIEMYGEADKVHYNGSYFYEIRSIDDGSKIISLYEKGTKRLLDHCRLNKFMAYSTFEEFVIGESTFEDVLEVDMFPGFMETDNGAMSEHRLLNNELLKITYSKSDDQYIIDDISLISPSTSKLYDLLTEEDRQQFID